MKISYIFLFILLIECSLTLCISNQSSQRMHKKIEKKIKIDKSNSFWQRFIHMAASIFSSGKLVITSHSSTNNYSEIDYTKGVIIFNR